MDACWSVRAPVFWSLTASCFSCLHSMLHGILGEPFQLAISSYNQLASSTTQHLLLRFLQKLSTSIDMEHSPLCLCNSPHFFMISH